MDVNLSKKKVAGFLGQSYVLIPRKVLEMLFHGKGRDRSVGMVYLALFSEVFFKDGQVYFNNRCYTCKRGEYIGLRENLAKSCEMSLTTLDRNLVWLKERELIGMKRLNGGVCISLCGYDSIMGIRRKEAGKEAPEQSAFLALEEAERRMGGRSMQFDCCTADGEGGLQ
ncbi:hypothetical protein [Parabacteroides merdae]|uniref:Uncharacterized protein n=1 Tax=Parabacteroides merdae TaxID=46503 RepID=A0A7K1HBI6_9BACT|nr:hypothetical protein [Parabacteroides merdae]MBS4864705.1 hypothetical protein [Parabacteroides merdae]MTU28579.1 hypothetical protein [Parabacteroides merdae]RYS85458.1 hypothetical protein EAJ15_03175 [Parabacteroides merdae]